MTNKKSWLLTAILALVMAVCLFALPACGTKYAVTWEIKEGDKASTNANIVVEGFDELPTEVKEGTQLVVSIEGTNGYEVSSVKKGKTPVTANKEGKYLITVTSDMNIVITVKEVLKSVTVKTNPTNLTYYAGESVDQTGMEVELEYETGRKETTDNYSIVYPSGGDSFVIGDTSFAVKSGKVTSAAVNLTAAVEAKVVIDPQGGVIADEYYSALQANNEISNLTKGEDGVISFTHAQVLTAGIALPSADQVVKGEGDDYVFQGWSGSIAAGNATSVKVVANYQANLIVVNAIGYELRENVPYLVITGEFKAAESAYLYLYEGNDLVELNGPAVNGTRGDTFELLFDMRGLVAEDEETGAQTYLGKWMDIKFRAQFGDRVETQEINLNNYADDFCDTSEFIRYDGYQYGFQVHTPGGTNQRNLKAVATAYFDHSYTISSRVDDNDDVILIFNGKINVSEYYGKAVAIDFWVTETVGATAPIDANGNYTLELNLAAAALENTGYAHFKIVESVEDSTELFKDGSDGNLLNTWCVNEDLSNDYIGTGLITGGAIRCANSTGSKTYYVGHGQWGGIVLYGKNEDPQSPVATMTSATVEIRDGKPSYVLYGTYAYATEDMFVVDLQEMSGWQSMTITSVVNLKDDGTFEIVSDLSAIEPLDAYMLSHFVFNGNSKDVEFKGSADGIIASIAVGGKVYTARYEAASAWNRPVVLFSVKEGDAPEIEVATRINTAMTLVSEGDKVYVQVTGTYVNMTEDEVKAAYAFDAEVGAGANTGNKTLFTEEAGNITWTFADGTFTVKLDVTDLGADGPYWMHYASGKDLTATADAASAITIGDKTYVLRNHVFSWGNRDLFCIDPVAAE